MKSVLSNKCCEKKEKPFPKLVEGKATGNVYLMTNRNCGTIVHSGVACNPLGSNFNTLDVSDGMYKDYEGDVCLTNEEP